MVPFWLGVFAKYHGNGSMRQKLFFSQFIMLVYSLSLLWSFNSLLQVKLGFLLLGVVLSLLARVRAFKLHESTIVGLTFFFLVVTINIIFLKVFLSASGIRSATLIETETTDWKQRYDQLEEERKKVIERYDEKLNASKEKIKKLKKKLKVALKNASGESC